MLPILYHHRRIRPAPGAALPLPTSASSVGSLPSASCGARMPRCGPASGHARSHARTRRSDRARFAGCAPSRRPRSWSERSRRWPSRRRRRTPSTSATTAPRRRCRRSTSCGARRATAMVVAGAAADRRRGAVPGATDPVRRRAPRHRPRGRPGCRHPGGRSRHGELRGSGRRARRRGDRPRRRRGERDRARCGDRGRGRRRLGGRRDRHGVLRRTLRDRMRALRRADRRRVRVAVPLPRRAAARRAAAVWAELRAGMPNADVADPLRCRAAPSRRVRRADAPSGSSA